ncbi:ead/Ea22-like family protein [Pseudomonas aeruginosa]|uniref:ead/Ea22-like family protein n=1 Tax=Pseudomonas aeruginosa TaxID=287 RepID=UPI00244BE68D|nr:ead/Ea22-like family protein [Pseudomonas aeruginosa]MDH0070054.1 ead/Ea22-like family protein [Pseudomonas aeruginosa]
MDEPLFNELLESVKQADQIMTDHAELRRLAKAATPGPWTLYVPEDYQGPDELPGYGVECAEGRAIVWGALEPETGCQFDRDAEFIAAANPNTILALLDEIGGLNDELSACTEHPGGCGYWREAAKRRAEERDRLRAQNDALRGALQAVQAEVDGNLRPLTRDLVNMVSGLNNGTHPNDIYDHCDEIERIIDAALEGATQ